MILPILIVSLTPGIFWLWFFVRKDNIRPEPRRLIAFTFLFGCLSAIPAAIGNFVFGADMLVGETPALASVFTAMLLIVGPVEEFCKFGAVRLGPYRSPNFDEAVDGLVYSFAASLGFASLENLFYVIQFWPSVMLLRAPLSTVGHLAFGSIWGLALGQHYVSGGGRRSFLIGTLALAAGAHALFNVFIFSFPPGAIALTLVSCIWSFRTFGQSQWNAPLSFRRNYPRVRCKNCRRAMSALNRFCTNCGAPGHDGLSPIICSSCGILNRPEAAFCISCGDGFLK